MKNSESDVFLIFKKKKKTNCTFLNFGATIELKSNSRSQNIFGHLILSIQRLMKAYKVLFYFFQFIYFGYMQLCILTYP